MHSSTAEYLTYIAASGGDSENVEILYQDENIWLTQKMMAALYDVTVSAINQHLKTIYDDTELQRETTIKKYLIVQSEGSREVKREVEHYNLQAIIAVHRNTAAELQAERKIPMSMEDWAKRLDGFLEFNGNEILTGPGKISHEEAKLHAETEYEKYRLIQDRLFESDFDRVVKKIGESDE